MNKARIVHRSHLNIIFGRQEKKSDGQARVVIPSRLGADILAVRSKRSLTFVVRLTSARRDHVIVERPRVSPITIDPGITDQVVSSYLIHSLRLSYLRHIDDPYGPRILSLDPGYSSNAHILASGLADQESWPEIVMPSTPKLADEEPSKNNKRHSGFPGATGLNYSQTIVGQNRTGAMGMRVNGKRGSLIKEVVVVAEGSEETVGKRHRSDSEPTPTPTSPAAHDVDPVPEKSVTSILLRRRSADAAELEEAPAPNSTAKIEPFKPPFARAAEMEARRQIRMRSRFALTSIEPQPLVTLDTQPVNPEASEDESSSGDDLSLLGNDIPLEGEDAVEDDFFDPCVEPPRTIVFRLM